MGKRKKILVMGGEAIRNHIKGPVTVKHKELLASPGGIPHPPDIRAMPTVEADKCIMCGTCVKVCPSHCLTMEKDDKDNGMILLNVAQCMICGHCETYCPKDCIHTSGSDPLHFSFDNRTDYRVICEKGSFEGERSKKILDDAVESGKKLKATLKGWAGRS